MGLDMFAYATAAPVSAAVDFETSGLETVQLHYWRKHPNLHGWMERLYRQKGGTDESFNSVPVQLTAEDLDALETAIKEGGLPSTSGFFFGASDGSEKDDDLEFVAEARAALSEGKVVFYDSWW